MFTPETQTVRRMKNYYCNTFQYRMHTSKNMELKSEAETCFDADVYVHYRQRLSRDRGQLRECKGSNSATCVTQMNDTDLSLHVFSLKVYETHCDCRFLSYTL
jgi:hypothetical protein